MKPIPIDSRAERIQQVILALTGAGLMVAGLLRRSLFGFGVALLGAAVAQRSLAAYFSAPRRVPPLEKKSLRPARPRAKLPDIEQRPDMPDIDLVDEAGFESFPASDPPSYAGR